MAEPLERLLAGSREPGLAELRETLRDLAGDDVSISAETKIKTRVFRVALHAGDRTRPLVLKRLEPALARRNALVAQEWLPAAGLEAAGPPLAAVAAARDGSWVWHVYDDLGDHDLVGAPASGSRAGAAIALIASLHARFADHHLLPDIRREGGDLGIHFFETSVRDLAASLQRLLRARPAPEHAELCERLLACTDRLFAESPERAEALTIYGGPETLLHGDLWTTNTFVLAGDVARLIDWDHAAVGPVAYDLSTFVSRFPAGDRRTLVARYRAAAQRLGV